MAQDHQRKLQTALKERLDKALSRARDNGEDVSYKTKVVTRLRNGGLLMELGSDEAVTWFSGQDVRKRFLEKLHPGTSTKTRDYHVVIQFVPLTFKPDRDADLREIEEINGLVKGSICRARWIKPVERCSTKQTCGHAIFSFPSPQAANDMLAGGLYVCQKKVYGEKCKKEPL